MLRNLRTKSNVGKYLTLAGQCEEIVYKDHAGQCFASLSMDNNQIESIWLNSKEGAAHNDEFSFRITGDAIPSFIEKYGPLSSRQLKEFSIVCNNALLESLKEKPFTGISTVEELEEFLMYKTRQITKF